MVKVLSIESSVKSQEGGEKSEPHDTYRIAYIIHFLLGAGNLLPWNTFITAADYFGYIYPDFHVEKVFSVAFMASSLVVLIGVTFLGGGMSFRCRMNLGLIMFAVSLLVTPLMDWAWDKPGTVVTFVATVASVVVCGLSDGLIGGTLLGMAGILPKEYMQAALAGTASSGLLVCILRIITKASLPHTADGLQKSAHFYFIVSSIVLLLCIACCNLLFKLPVMEQYYRKFRLDYPSLRPNLWTVAKKIRGSALGIFLNFTITQSIFPGYLAEDLKSKLLEDWYSILLITTYNMADLAGKSLTAIYVMKSIKKATWSSVARIFMYPLFVTVFHGPQWLRTEIPILILTFALGFTHGYLTSVLMILTPKSVPSSEAEVSALVMAVFIGFGLVSGSVVGWFWII